MGLSKLCRVAGMVGLAAALGVAGCGDHGAATPGQVGPGGSAGTSVDPSIDGQLTINELMPDNVLTVRDDRGAASPWIEIYNPTGQDIPLGGYGITDDFTAPGKTILPAGVVAPAGGHLLLWADGNASAGPAHLGVLLSHAGGSLALARPDGSFIDRLTYGAQETDISAAREPDGSGSWISEWNVSPGAANPSGAGQPFPAQAIADPPEAVPAAGDMSERVLGYDLIPQFDLEISDDNIASLRAAPATWVQASLVYEGRSYGPVGVNLKGTSSFQPIDGKPGFRVNVNKFVSGARFFGLKEFLLNNMTTRPIDAARAARLLDRTPDRQRPDVALQPLLGDVERRAARPLRHRRGAEGPADGPLLPRCDRPRLHHQLRRLSARVHLGLRAAGRDQRSDR